MATPRRRPPLEPEVLQAISKKVFQRFPEVAGKKPRIRRPKMANGREPDKPRNFLLIYRATALGPGGKRIPRLVRVVVSPGGKILKMSTSRG